MILTSRSSYREELCYDAGGNPETDTVQTWVGPESTFMIHTYALDHDIRIFHVKSKPNGLELIDQINQKNYGDVIDQHIVMEFANVHDAEDLRQTFAEHGLQPTVRIEDGAFMFWRYGDAQYKTISDPLG